MVDMDFNTDLKAQEFIRMGEQGHWCPQCQSGVETTETMMQLGEDVAGFVSCLKCGLLLIKSHYSASYTMAVPTGDTDG